MQPSQASRFFVAVYPRASLPLPRHMTDARLRRSVSSFDLSTGRLVAIEIKKTGVSKSGGLADLGNFWREGLWETERAKRASIEGVWAYGRMKFERLSPGFGSRRGTKRHRNNLSHMHNNKHEIGCSARVVTSPRSAPA